jgi:hypothetical protein
MITETKKRSSASELSFIDGAKMIYRTWDISKDCLFLDLKLKYAIPLLAIYFLVMIALIVQGIYYQLF